MILFLCVLSSQLLPLLILITRDGATIETNSGQMILKFFIVFRGSLAISQMAKFVNACSLQNLGSARLQHGGVFWVLKYIPDIKCEN